MPAMPRPTPAGSPTSSPCTGTPSARAAATGSSPAFTAPSETRITPSGRRSAGRRASAASALPGAVAERSPAPRALSASSPDANADSSSCTRPRSAERSSRTAFSAAAWRGPPPARSGRSMLVERSSSTTTRVPEVGSERSSTGMASSHTSTASDSARIAVRSRRELPVSGGSRNEYAHRASTANATVASANRIQGAFGARCSEAPIKSCSDGGGRACGALLVGQAQALEDEAVEVQVERDVLAFRTLAGQEPEAAVTPQDDVVHDAAQHLVHGVRDLLARGLALLHQQLADAALRIRALLLERATHGGGGHRAAVHEQLA